MNKFFLHQIRGHQDTIDNKGIVVAESIEAAKQGYHAFLGAYAYGHDQSTDFVSCMITNQYGNVEIAETWNQQNEITE